MNEYDLMWQFVMMVFVCVHHLVNRSLILNFKLQVFYLFALYLEDFSFIIVSISASIVLVHGTLTSYSFLSLILKFNKVHGADIFYSEQTPSVTID